MGSHTYSQLKSVARDIVVTLRSPKSLPELKRHGFDTLRSICRDMHQCEGMDSVEVDVVGNDVWMLLRRAK